MNNHSGVFLSVFSHLPDALAADILPAEGDQISERTAENTGRLKFLQNNPVVLHIDFQFVPLGNVQGTAQFDGQHNSSQFIHFPDDACRFHKFHCFSLQTIHL